MADYEWPFEYEYKDTELFRWGGEQYRWQLENGYIPVLLTIRHPEHGKLVTIVWNSPELMGATTEEERVDMWRHLVISQSKSAEPPGESKIHS